MPAPDAALLAGKVAVVTGGGGGIGRAISETFAAHGAKVVVAEIDADRASETVAAIRAERGEALAHPVDVRQPDEVASLADATLTEYGRVDVLVNNVGAVHPRLNGFLNVSDEDFEASLQLNFFAAVRATRAAVADMATRGRGRSSTSGRSTRSSTRTAR
jgi:NAD(P)-dependent dehydrogenase (short-subunit alcohol dehydrogenase family)